MTSKVDIVNEALAQCGTQSTISSFDEGSPESNIASLLYQTKIDALFRAAHWGFARYQVLATLLKQAADPTTGAPSSDPPPKPWLFSYSYPEDCIQLRFIPRVMNPNTATPSPPLTTGTSSSFTPQVWAEVPAKFVIGTDFDSEGNRIKVILTNEPLATLVYTARIEDPDLWDPAFREAAVATLAAWFVNPLNMSKSLIDTNMAIATAVITQARISDGNEQWQSQDHQPDWISVRKGGGYGSWWTDPSMYGWWSPMTFPNGLSY